jgi:DNA polymerase
MSNIPSDLSVDFETQAAFDLKLGVHGYAAHPLTAILCMAYGLPLGCEITPPVEVYLFSDGPPLGEVGIWIEGEPFPDCIAAFIAAGGRLRAWNAAFERVIWRDLAERKYGWPSVRMDQWVCTMAEALAMALPGALKNAAPAVGLEIQKDLAGSRIMMQLCKPRPSDGKLWRPTDPGAPSKFQTLYSYCIQDVKVEQAIVLRVKRLQQKEQRLYYITETINDHGVYIDAALCEACQRVIDEANKRLTLEMRKVSDYVIAGPNAVAQIKEWLVGKGFPMDSLDKDHLATFLVRDDLPADVRRVIEIRQQAAKTSTSKIATMLARRGKGGRARGMFRYHGAGTGRFSVNGLQLQNYTRPDGTIDIEEAIADIFGGDFDWIEAMHGSALNVVATLLRSCISASPGRKLHSVDLSQIELRMNAFLSGQDDAVEGFRAYDRKEGPDAYVVSAAGIYGIPIKEVDKEIHRPVGKIAELALGFLGGAGALLKMAKNNRVDLRKIENSVRGAASLANIEKAEDAWKSRGHKSGAGKVQWVTAELIKLAWRDSHPAIVAFAYGLENTAIEAMQTPNVWHHIRDISYRKSGSFLCCKLPSKRVIYYPSARLGESETPWGKVKRVILAKTQNINNQWVDRALTPGILIENAVQAASRDVMTDAMHEIDTLYPEYDVSLSIHDELVAEADIGVGSLDELTNILATPPAWLPLLPLAAAGWSGTRFRK